MMTLRTKRGFTLIEVMLVGLIIAFVAAIAVPSFINSLKGQRLIQARRTVMACGRYARAMAVSRQQPMHVVLTVGSGSITVEAGPMPAAESAPIYTRDQLTGESNAALPELPPDFAAEESAHPAAPSRNMSRDMEGVIVKSLYIRDGLNTDESQAVIIPYKANGTCPPYELVLMDEDGAESTINVDFLGDASYEEEE